MLQTYIMAVQELSKGLIQGQKLDPWLALLCRKLSTIIGCARASVWKYDSQRQEIICLCLYDNSSPDQVDLGLSLRECDFPNYFRELKLEQIIDATEALTDPRTAEFSEGYLKPLGIFSMLDTPIFLHGSLYGVICLEHRSGRNWSLEEQMLARSMADLCSIAFLQAQLQEALNTIEKQKNSIEEINASLESRVAERTEELEKQNELLIEYSFINSHLLRGPICTLKGLVSLMEMDDLKDDHPEFIKKMSAPIDQLSALSDKMNLALSRGITLSRNELRQKDEE